MKNSQIKLNSLNGNFGNSIIKIIANNFSNIIKDANNY